MKKIKYIFICLFLSFFSYSKNVLAAGECQGILGDELTIFIKDLYYMIGYVVLAVAVILGMLDFFKVFTGGDKSDFKAVAQKLAKRLIALAIFFMLPSLIEWILNVAGISSDTCL